MAHKPSLIIFTQNKIGGVQFFYSNLVKAGAFESFEVSYLEADESGDHDARLVAPLEGASTTKVRFTGAENVYSVLRRTAQKIPPGPGIALTNWHFELDCLGFHPRPDLTVAHVCHDQGYVEVAVRHAPIIDVFIAHNPHFAEVLKKALPPDRAGDVYFVPFGILQETRLQRKPNASRPLRIVYVGRLHKAKGVLLLPQVDDRLVKLGVHVQWSVLGSGPEQEALERAISGRGNFAISSPIDGSAMLRQAAEGDVFILPSQVDGTPLAVMEAMSVGLVPIVSEFNPGAHWMVPPQVGFVCPREATALAAIIKNLHENRGTLEACSLAALDHARREFDVTKRAGAYSELCFRWKELKRKDSDPAPLRHYGGRLDQPWMPNWIVLGLRGLRELVRVSRARDKRN